MFYILSQELLREFFPSLPLHILKPCVNFILFLHSHFLLMR